MPFPPNYQPTKRGAPLKDALADARWVINNAEDTVHATHKVIVDCVVAGLPWSLLEEAADAVIEARADLADGREIIERWSWTPTIPRSTAMPGR
jgi:hypothetical protein